MNFKANYLGGFPRQKPRNGVRIDIDNDGVKVKHTFGDFTVPWFRITEISVEGPDEIRRRFTATRLVLFWPGGLAWKKKAKQEVFVVVAGTWGEFVLEAQAKSPHELQGKLAPWTRRLAAKPERSGPAPATTRTETTDSVAEELERLADLHGRGALTTEEFEAAKARALGL